MFKHPVKTRRYHLKLNNHKYANSQGIKVKRIHNIIDDIVEKNDIILTCQVGENTFTEISPYSGKIVSIWITEGELIDNHKLLYSMDL